MLTVGCADSFLPNAEALSITSSTTMHTRFDTFPMTPPFRKGVSPSFAGRNGLSGGTSSAGLWRRQGTVSLPSATAKLKTANQPTQMRIGSTDSTASPQLRVDMSAMRRPCLLAFCVVLPSTVVLFVAA